MEFSRRQACSMMGGLLALPTFSFLGSAGSRFPRTSDTTEFLAAVRAGELGRVEEMLAVDGELARAQDELGRSALVLAYLHGHADVGVRLGSVGFDLDIVEAVLTKNWERFKSLGTAHPEQIGRAHAIGGTPLYAAAIGGGLDQFYRLRHLGCAPNAAPKGGSGFTPARGAMESAHDSWARIALMDICSNGGDVNARQRGGSSVLHGAVSRRDPGIVRLALRKHADVDAVDDEGRTPRQLAAQLGWEAGESLLAKESSLPRDNRSSRLALGANGDPIDWPDLVDVPQSLQDEMTLRSHSQLKSVRELIASEKRLAFANSAEDELAIEACAHRGSPNIIRYLLDHGAPLSLPTAVSLVDFDAVSFLLERDPTLIHERGAHDFPVLWYAVLGGGSVPMAELLVHHGVPLDQESVGTTTLHWCVRRRNRDLALWLIEHGADAEAIGYRWSHDGQTPLQVALADRDTRMATLLKDAGARR